MIKQIHLASQYLAAAAISFGEKKEDDSHTNLGWDVGKHHLISQVFSKFQDQLGIDMNSFSLYWMRYNTEDERIDLEGKSHAEILEWIREKVKEAGLDGEYNFSFHYELPYPFPGDSYQYSVDEEGLKTYNERMDLGSRVLTDLYLRIKGGIPPRIWPHHFDMGFYAQVREELGLGFGLAIPDDKLTDYYFYLTGYVGDNMYENKDFPDLRYGEWQKGDWKAATLIAGEASFDGSLDFFEEAVSFYMNGG